MTINAGITPFTVSVPDASLQDLKQRLALTRWPDRETTAGTWDQGVPVAYAHELARYWAEHYDWRRCEATLNSWPQFTTMIDGIDIHFIHRRSSHENALPLIISHGWPSSVMEFHKIIDVLADPVAHGGKAEDAFHVIVPSLPGFGFSGKPSEPGTSAEKIGRMWGTLMSRLGYARYVAHGGDWGSLITQSMGQTELEHCAGIHTTLPLAPPDPATMDDLTPGEVASLEATAFYSDWLSGYSKPQSTRPQTIGYALADSPVGQMAWIIEKFYDWTDCERDGVKHPEHALTRDEMLDNVMFYWLNNAAASSARLYWESFNKPNLDPINIPVGCSIFPREIIMRPSRRWAEKRFSNVIHWNELDQGGHFTALEQPALLVKELRDCFSLLR